MEIVREFFRAPRDLWMMLGSVGNAITLILIAGFSISFPPLSEFVRHFGEWTKYFWNLIPFVEVSEFTAKALTVISITLLVILRGRIAGHPHLPAVLRMGRRDKSKKGGVTPANWFNIAFSIVSTVLGTLSSLTSVSGVFNFTISPAIQEGALYIAILCLSSYYPRAFFALMWAIGIVFSIDFVGNTAQPIFDNAPWNN